MAGTAFQGELETNFTRDWDSLCCVPLGLGASLECWGLQQLALNANVKLCIGSVGWISEVPRERGFGFVFWHWGSSEKVTVPPSPPVCYRPIPLPRIIHAVGPHIAVSPISLSQPWEFPSPWVLLQFQSLHQHSKYFATTIMREKEAKNNTLHFK